MGGYGSIEDLKSDENIRNLIKESINSIYDMQKEYHESVKEVTKINVGSDVIGSNEVNSGGGVMIGSGKGGINISQSTNLQTEMQTMYYGNFLSNNDEPIVQLVSSDLLNMTQKDNAEKEMPNFYDPVYIMSLLGFNVKFAEFDFENDRIKYIVDYGDAKDQIDEQNIQEYEKMNEEQKAHKNHNEKYELKRKYLLEIQDKLKEANKKYNDLLTNGGKGTVKSSDLTAVQSEILIAQQNVDKDIVDLQNNKVVNKKQKEKYEDRDIRLDPKVEEKLNTVLNDKIFKENVENIKKQYIEEAKKAGVSEKDATEQLTNNTIISLFNSVLSQSKDSIVSIYGEEAVNNFSNSITDYLTSYNSYMQTVFLTMVKECLSGYSEKNSSDEVKELKALDDKYRSDINVLNELNVKYQDLSDQFDKENPDITEELFELGNEIKRLTAELSSNESTLALKYYEYYDTEPITKELISKIDEDVARKYKLMNEYDGDPNFKALRDKSTNLSNSYIFSTQDADYDMVQIQNNKAYQNNVKKMTSGLEKENENMKKIKSQITNTEEYKKAYDEYTKNMYDIQKDYVTVSEIVNYSKNQKLIDLYSEYIEEREKYYNSITLKTIVDYKNKDNKKDDVKKLKELFEKYNKDVDLAKKYKKEYDEVQEQMKKMDKNDKYVEVSDEWQKLRTARIKLENVLDAYENSITIEYQYMTFEKLYDMLTSGYVANINEKILNIKDKVKNIETNITRSTYNYAKNKIFISGNLGDVNLSQNNTAIQKMYDGFEKIITEADKLVENDKNNSELNGKDDDESTGDANDDPNDDPNNNADDPNNKFINNANSNNNKGFFKKNIILMLIVLIAVCILFLAAIIYYKRKVNIASMAHMTNSAY